MAVERRYVVLAKVFRSVAHDLNNMLQAVSSTAELMVSRAELPEDIRRKSERIYLKAQDAALRLEQVAALTRMGTGAARQQNLGAALASALVLEQRTLAQSRVAVSAPSPLPAAFTLAAPGSLEFLFVHLLEEIARAFTATAGATLTVSIDPAEDAVVLVLFARDAPVGERSHGAADARHLQMDVSEPERLVSELGGQLAVNGDRDGFRVELRLPRSY